MDEQDFEPGLSAGERADLTAIGDRIQADRPVPHATFRGDLRRLLIERTPSSRRRAASERWRVLTATYSALGALLLAVAAIGLVGVGPFAA
jgi:hypothetical protein